MEFREGMACPVCESGKLFLVNKTIEFNYKRNIRKFETPVYTCPECGEEFLGAGDQKEIDRQLTNSRRQIDGLLTPEDIRRIRQKFGYTQIEFAKVLKIGEKNFARYENGQSAQGRAMDNLLRVLDCYPESIHVMGGRYPAETNNMIHSIC